MFDKAKGCSGIDIQGMPGGALIVTKEQKEALYDMLLADNKEEYIEAAKKLASETPMEVIQEMADETFS